MTPHPQPETPQVTEQHREAAEEVYEFIRNGSWSSQPHCETQIAAILARRYPASAASTITDEILEAVEGEIGMGHQAWDCVNPKELIAAVLKVAGVQPAASDAGQLEVLRRACEAADEALDNLHDNASNPQSYDRWMRQVDKARLLLSAALSAPAAGERDEARTDAGQLEALRLVAGDVLDQYDRAWMTGGTGINAAIKKLREAYAATTPAVSTADAQREAHVVKPQWLSEAVAERNRLVEQVTDATHRIDNWIWSLEHNGPDYASDADAQLRSLKNIRDALAGQQPARGGEPT